MSEHRRYLRTKFESRVKIEHPTRGTAIFRTSDISDGGVYIAPGEFGLEQGDVVSVQIQDVPFEAPIVKMKVVRSDNSGHGLEFVH